MQEDLRKETLHKQFQLVKKRTNTSHVMQYGNKVGIWAGFLKTFSALSIFSL